MWDVALLQTLGRDALWAGVAAVGFAMLFNVPVRTLAGCFIGGALGHALRTLLMGYGVGIEAGTLAGATLIGFLGMAFARIWKAPSPVFTVPGAITMVPGVFAFRTMLGVLALAASGDMATGNAALWSAGLNATKTALILAAIATGIAAPSLIFGRRKPVV